jgi:hypothetical protein
MFCTTKLLIKQKNNSVFRLTSIKNYIQTKKSKEDKITLNAASKIERLLQRNESYLEWQTSKKSLHTAWACSYPLRIDFSGFFDLLDVGFSLDRSTRLFHPFRLTIYLGWICINIWSSNVAAHQIQKHRVHDHQQAYNHPNRSHRHRHSICGFRKNPRSICPNRLHRQAIWHRHIVCDDRRFLRLCLPRETRIRISRHAGITSKLCSFKRAI